METINSDDFLLGNELTPTKSVQYRPLSPPPGVQPNIFRPFPKDMCGNPTAYFFRENMKLWEKKQVMEVSTHCANWSVFVKAIKRKDRQCELYKKKVDRRDWHTAKMLRRKTNELNKIKSRAYMVESTARSVVTFKAENEAYKTENERLRQKQMEDIELLLSKNTENPIAAMKLELEKMEQKYFQMKEEIKWRDNVIEAQADENKSLHQIKLPSPTTVLQKKSPPKLSRKESSA